MLYVVLGILALPLLLCYLLLRILQGKENFNSFPQKLGMSMAAAPFKRIIWFHAASIGELNSIIPLIRYLNEEWEEEAHFLVTTQTLTSAEIFTRAQLDNATHQFFPIDVAPITWAFLKKWEPSLAIFTESEIWPATIFLAHIKCPMILLNARFSERSARRWRRYAPPVLEPLLNRFSLILAGSTKDATRLSAVTTTTIECLGNLKHAAPPLSLDEDRARQLKRIAGSRKIIVASSTHPGEEAMILAAYQQLATDALLVIIPRHPKRCNEIGKLIKNSSLNYILHQGHSYADLEAEVYLVNTIGELGTFYAVADVIFVGGSLVKHGGQNVLEAAHFAKPIIVGNYTFNFADIIKTMEEAGAIKIIHNQEELLQAIETTLAEPNLATELAENAIRIATSSQDILPKTAERVSHFIS
jgi:3-deoxy-D-manno-octulosonic-acid transferase